MKKLVLVLSLFSVFAEAKTISCYFADAHGMSDTMFDSTQPYLRSHSANRNQDGSLTESESILMNATSVCGMAFDIKSNCDVTESKEGNYQMSLNCKAQETKVEVDLGNDGFINFWCTSPMETTNFYSSDCAAID